MMLRRVVSEHAAAGEGLDGAGAGKPRGAAHFAVPRLLVGLAAARCAPADCGSPTSPLDLRAFAALGGSLLRSPRSPRSWDSRRAGLGGLVDKLAEPAADAKNLLLGAQMRPAKPQCLTKSFSLPRGCGNAPQELGEAEAMSVPCSRFYGDVKSGPEAVVPGGALLGLNSHSADLGKSLPASIGDLRRYIGPVSATEVEQSEDYTCIIAHGPNPKTTHILGDCILEPCAVPATDGESNEAHEVKEGTGSYWLVKCSGDAGVELMRFCLSCEKKLDDDYDVVSSDAGEKSFCSANCREQEVLTEEEVENSMTVSSPSSGVPSSFHEDIFMDGMVVLT